MEGRLEKLKAVVFDLDGVLVDSFEVWRRLFNLALSTRGHDPLSAREFQALWGQGVEADIRMFFPGATVPELQKFYEDHFGKCLNDLRVFPDTLPVVDTLARRGLKLGIASNSAPRIIAGTLTAAGLDGRFSAVVGAGGPLKGKPEPDTLLAALDELGAKPGEAVFIGDSPYDIEAGRRAGVATIGFQRDGGSWRIERLGELLDLPPFRDAVAVSEL
jgi:HAD superfamily hydrolase (TIGR01509 family)